MRPERGGKIPQRQILKSPDLFRFEPVELGRELSDPSGSSVPMERPFGHGFVQG